MEHHSNILPWQLWCERNNGKLKVIPINRDGTLQIEKLEGLITHNTAVVALTHVSNTLGIINPVNEIIRKVKAIDQRILVLIDGAQSVPHMSIDVKNMDCDFFVFSGHKMYAPTGCGVLYVKKGLMDQLKLSRTGGGTINIEAVIGLAKACEFMNSIGTNNISDHEHALLVYAQNELRAIEGVEIYADHSNKAAVISFNVKGQHPFDVGTLLDKYGVAVFIEALKKGIKLLS